MPFQQADNMRSEGGGCDHILTELRYSLMPVVNVTEEVRGVGGCVLEAVQN